MTIWSSITHSRKRWIILAAGSAGLLALAVVMAAGLGWITLPWMQTGAPDDFDPQRMAGAGMGSVPIQPANLLIEDLQLTGKLTLRTVREVTAPFGEAVDSIEVSAGDLVQSGGTLLTLDREQLETDLDSAWLDVMDAREALVQLTEPSTELEQMDAQAQLLVAQEALTKLLEGPTASDI